MPTEYTYFSEPRPAVMVVSHERSGTHFLMNSLAACFGYVSVPWINFDIGNENVLARHTRAQLRQTLLGLAERPLANIVKSHHTADFFTGELNNLTQRYFVAVIYRHPADVMLSFWRYMHHYRAADDAGPQTADPIAFAKAHPSGLIDRYQTQPCASMLERWAVNVRSWHLAAQSNTRIAFIRYEDLDRKYEATMRSLAPFLERDPHSFARPARDKNVVPRGPEDPMGTRTAPDVLALRKLCWETVGDVMQLLGYGL